MSPSSASAKLPLARIVLVGAIVPIGLAILDQWLLSRIYGPSRQVALSQAVAVFIVQVGMLGVLCAKLVEPVWLRWLIYAWSLLLTNLNAASSVEYGELNNALFTAEIGMVTVWAILGTTRWTLRVLVVLLLAIPLLSSIAQTAALCLICLMLRSQRFQLRLVNPSFSFTQTAGGLSASPIQFSIGEVLLWMTAHSPSLAIARVGAWQTLTQGILHAIVLVVALYAVLGQGPVWVRWSLLAVFAL